MQRRSALLDGEACRIRRMDVKLMLIANKDTKAYVDFGKSGWQGLFGLADICYE
jgi:hypothetical protein